MQFPVSSRRGGGGGGASGKMRIAFLANTDWYLYNFRRALAHSIVDNGHDLVLLSPRGPYVDKLQDFGFSWKEVSLHRSSANPLVCMRDLVSITRRLRQVKPDILHCFTIRSVLFGGIAAKLSGVRHCIHAITGLGYLFANQSSKSKVKKSLAKLALSRILNSKDTQLILQNNDDASELSECGMAPIDRTYVIRGSGVDTSVYSKHSPPQRTHSFSVLLPTRLLSDKGVYEFIEAASTLKQSGKKL